MVEFNRTRKEIRHLPLTSLIDVVFILIIFFMLTTSFMHYESMELLLPSAGGAKTQDPADKETARVVIYNDGSISFGARKVDERDLNRTLSSMLTENPNRRVVVFSDDEVSMQKLVSVMDIVTSAGGKSLYVRPLQKQVSAGVVP